MRTMLAVAGTLAATLAPTVAHAEPTPYQLEVGPSVAMIARAATSDGSGVTYEAGLGLGALFRITFLPWLRGSVRYMQSHHGVSYTPGALGVPGTLSSGSLAIDWLSVAVHPTWSPTSRAHLWGTLGAGWSHAVMRQLDVSGGAHVRGRSGLFADVPLGLGGGYDVLRWLTASIDLAWAPTFGVGGDLFSADIYYDAAGKAANVAAFPAPRSSIYAIANLAFALLRARSRDRPGTFNSATRSSNAACCFQSAPGSRSANFAKNSFWSFASSTHAFGSMSRSWGTFSGEMSSPRRSIASGVGMCPIAVFFAAALPRMRSTIHESTRTFSPNPGQRNFPSVPVRNQFTWKIFGGLVSLAPTASQCAK